MFDDFDDDEDDHKRNFSGNPSYQSTLRGYRNVGNDDSLIQFDSENDTYEKVVNKKELHNEDITDESHIFPDSFGYK